METTNFRIFKFQETLDHKYINVYCDCEDCPVIKAKPLARNYLEGLGKLWDAEVSVCDSSIYVVGSFSFKNPTAAHYFYLYLLSVRGMIMSNR